MPHCPKCTCKMRPAGKDEREGEETLYFHICKRCKVWKAADEEGALVWEGYYQDMKSSSAKK